MSIVVTGIGHFTACGGTAKELLESTPVHPPQPFTRVDESEAIAWIPRKNLRKMDRLSRITTAAVAMAIADAGLDDEVDAEETGLILDTGFGSAGAVSKVLDGLYEEIPAISPLLFPNVVANAASGQAAISFGLRGPSSTLGGIGGLMYAFDLMRAGRARRLIVGASDEISDIYADALVERGLTNLVPFFGDGGAFIVLELSEDAVARGARIYAELIDVAMASDPKFRLTGRDVFAGGGLTRAAQDVLHSAGSIDYVVGAGWYNTPLRAVELGISDTYSATNTYWPKDLTGEMFACSNSLNTVLASELIRTHADTKSVLVCGYDSTRGQSSAAVFRSFAEETSS